MAGIAERFVRIRADTKGFEAELRKGTGGASARAGARGGSDFSSAFTRTVNARLSKANFKVKVTPDFDGFQNLPNVPRIKVPGSPDDKATPRSPGGPATPGAPRTPRVPVELDPLVGAFQAETRRQLAALAKQVAVTVPVNPDTAALREDIADKIRIVERQLKVKVPAGPEARGFETDLRALVREVEHQIKVQLPIEPQDAAGAGRRAAREAEGAAGRVKMPVELDPLVSQFQANVRREVSALSRTVSARIPVTPETDGLRRQVALQIAAIERTLKIKVPVDSPNGRQVEAGLRNQLQGLRDVVGGALGVAPAGLTACPGGFDAITGSAARAAGAAGQLGGSLSSLAGPIGTALTIAAVAGVISALPAIALTASGAIIALGGALASLPAIGVGLGAIVGTLGLGFSGLSDHFKKTASSGGGAAKSMSAVRNAARSVTQAQRELLKATKDIDRARADEIERIDDLGRSLRGAYLDEADAAAAVAEARARLAEAKASGDPNEIGAAERAYQRSLLTLDEARDKTGDLAEEQDKAAKVGVEGSDQVQQALERQRDATERLQAAHEALADAQQSAASAGASAVQQLTKLAPAAQATVDKLKQLKPVFEDIRLSVQQALFEGVPDELQRLSDAWKKPLKDTLTSYASTINGLFMNLGKSVRDSEFISNITSAADTFRKNFDKIGKAVTGPLVDAFGRLAKAAEPFINVLGDKIAGLVEHFSAWIKSADESGKLDKFMSDAAYYLDQIWTIGGNVLGIFADLFGIFFDTKNQGGAKDYLEGLNKQLVAVREWLKDPENQEKIKAFIERIGEFVKKAEEIAVWITEKGLPALTDLINKIKEMNDTVDKWKDRFTTAKNAIVGAADLLVVGLLGPFSWIKGKLDEAVGWFNGLKNRLQFSGLFDGISGAFKTALNRVIDGWNGLRFVVPSFSFLGVSSPSFPIDTPNIPRLAKGGVVQPRPGGTAAVLAEAGVPEIAAPEPLLRDVVTDSLTTALANIGGVGGGDIVIPIYLFPGASEMDRIVVSAAERNKGTFAKIANSGNKRLGYAG